MWCGSAVCCNLGDGWYDDFGEEILSMLKGVFIAFWMEGYLGRSGWFAMSVRLYPPPSHPPVHPSALPSFLPFSKPPVFPFLPSIHPSILVSPVPEGGYPGPDLMYGTKLSCKLCGGHPSEDDPLLKALSMRGPSALSLQTSKQYFNKT